MIIAIDGPAGAGKSTTARGVADRLGFGYLDTGAMYRAVALAVLREGLVPEDPAPGTPDDLDEDAVSDVLDRHRVATRWNEDGMHVLLDGEDVGAQIRTSRVSDLVGRVSALPAVRRSLIELQRRAGRSCEEELGGAVAEGRDIGTVVFPEAEVKIYLVAEVRERARRRLRDLEAGGEEITYEEVVASIEERDRRDIEREVAPLRKAEDATEVDTTGLGVEDQIEKVAKIARERAER